MSKRTKEQQAREVKRTREQAAERRAAGVCVDCGKEKESNRKTCCDRCQSRRNETSRKLRERRRTKNLCYRCGHSQLVNGKRLCAACEQLQRDTYAAKIAAGICPQCGNNLDGGKQLCRACMDAASRRSNTHRARRRENGLCVKCGLAPPRSGGKHCKKCQAAWRHARQDRMAAGLCVQCKCPNDSVQQRCTACTEKIRQRNQDLRLECLMAYGGLQCACPGCTTTTIQFLQIDHVENNGAEHRREIGRGGICRWLKKNGFPPGYRVLCANCNLARGFYGECPHVTAIREAGLTQVESAGQNC